MESAAGNLHLTVPQNFKARVDASSQNGSVHNVLPQARDDRERTAGLALRRTRRRNDRIFASEMKFVCRFSPR